MTVQSQNTSTPFLSFPNSSSLPSQVENPVITSAFPPQKTREQRILDDIMSCEHTRELYERAIAAENPARLPYIPERQWTLKLGTPRFEAVTDFLTQMIEVNYHYSHIDALGSTIFELTNVEKGPQFFQLRQDLKHGKISIEEFAQGIEWLEYNGMHEHHRIVSKAVVQMGWSPEVDQYSDKENLSWDKYLLDQAHNGHSQCYRNEGKEIVRNRVYYAMRLAGYTKTQIASYNDTQLEAISYQKDDQALRSYLHQMRTFNMMTQLGFPSTQLTVWSEQQLVNLSLNNKTEATLRTSLLYWKNNSSQLLPIQSQEPVQRFEKRPLRDFSAQTSKKGKNDSL